MCQEPLVSITFYFFDHVIVNKDMGYLAYGNPIDRETQTNKPCSINNQKSHLGGQIVSLIFAITIWGLYIMAAVQSVKSITILLKSSEFKDMLSLAKDLIVFPGFLVLSITAGFIHAHIEHRRANEESLEVVNEFLGGILVLVTVYLFFISLFGLIILRNFF